MNTSSTIPREEAMNLKVSKQSFNNSPNGEGGNAMDVRKFSARKVLTAMVLTLAMIALPTSAFAVDNQGTGDVAGDGTALTDSNVFQLNSLTLAIVKRAFDLSDNPIPTGSSIPTGTQFKFMLYINNTTPVDVTDVTIQDFIDPAGFDYVLASTRVDSSVANCAAVACTPAEELAVFQAANLTGALDDTTDGDVINYVAGTTTLNVGSGNEALNADLTVPANSVLAVTFDVTMQ